MGSLEALKMEGGERVLEEMEILKTRYRKGQDKYQDKGTERDKEHFRGFTFE